MVLNQNSPQEFKTIPLGALASEDCHLTGEILCKAEKYKLQELRSTRYSIVHELLSDSTAVLGIGATALTVAFSGSNTISPEDVTSLQRNFISVAMVTPIVGALLWELRAIGSEYKAIKKIREVSQRHNYDPRILSAVGLKLEGVPKSVFELDEDGKKTVHSHIAESGGTALVEKLKKVSENLNRASKGNALQLPAPEKDTPETFSSFCAHTALNLGHLFYKDKTILKGMGGVVKSTAAAGWTLARQSGEAAAHYILKPAKHILDRLGYHSATYIQENYFAKPLSPIKNFIKSNEAIGTEDKSIPDCQQTLSEYQTNRTVHSIESDIKSATRQSYLTGSSLLLQAGFVFNETSHGTLLLANAVKTGNISEVPEAMAHFLAATLALRPLQVLSNRHVDLYRAVHSDRAIIAHQIAERQKNEEKLTPA